MKILTFVLTTDIEDKLQKQFIAEGVPYRNTQWRNSRNHQRPVAKFSQVYRLYKKKMLNC